MTNAFILPAAALLFLGSLAVTSYAAPASPSAAKTVKTPKAVLPLTIYAENGDSLPYSPSGYMGTTEAIKMDPSCAVQPHSGKTCLKVDYAYIDSWGGVVWQSPVNNWGTKPGGYDLSVAKTLTFWARGDKGGEVVSFAFGLLGPDKAFPDSGTGKLDVTLTKDWAQYTIPLAGKDLSRIQTGFAWSLASPGHAVTFYLDDIRYS